MQPSTVYCDTCGAANRPQARFCIACGQAMPAAFSLPLNAQSMPTIYPLSSTVQAESRSSSSSSTGLLPPNSLLTQRYLILTRLGQGGMGAVYKAADTKLGGRLVAVKEMAQKGLDPQEIVEAANGFKREALMLAGLPHHPHLPSIYDHFSDDGHWYLVMDFIEGETLEEYRSQAKEGRLTVEEVLDIGIQLATILGYLHTHQPPIVFRDLKPANVMRTADGQLYLIDFGIARHFKQGQAKDTNAYVSAGYAAPEQYGKAQTTSQSDIYSLGATLHHLLSGSDPSQSPFRFAPLAGTAILTELGKLIAQMVEMDADKRPTSMAEIKKELQRLATQAVESQNAPTQYVSGSSLPPTQLAAPMSPPPPAAPVLSVPPSPSPPPGTVLCTYRGHSESVNVVAWSSDGVRIVSGSKDKTVQIWDAATGKTLLTYQGHSDSVKTVAWSPDSTRIVSGGSDNTVQVWDAADGGHIFTYRGHSDTVMVVAWSPDGTHIASASSDDTVQVWDATTGQRLLTYHGHSIRVWAMAWSPDGTRIASGDFDGSVHVWEASTGTKLVTYEVTYGGHAMPLYRLAWSTDGTRIISSGYNLRDKTVQVWQAATGTKLVTYDDKLVLSPDGTRLASGSNDGIQVWDAVTGQALLTYSRGRSPIVWSPDGKRIASVSDDKTAQVWQAEQPASAPAPTSTVLSTEVVTVPPSQPPAFDPNATWGKLIFSNGKEAQLAGEQVLVGRVDNDVEGITPDVDLSDLPGADTTARLQATIEHVGSAYRPLSVFLTVGYNVRYK